MNRSTSLRICSSQEMRALDEIAEKEYGIDAIVLMENAGRAATQVLLETYPGAGTEREILVFAGKGNNAGDAFVVARRLICLDRKVRVFHLADESTYKGATLRNFEILRRLKAKMTPIENVADLEAFFASAPGPYTMVDGLIGTGLRGNLEGVFYDVVECLNQQQCDQVLALDIPSGVSGDAGVIHGTSIQASLTVSFGFPKLGHFLPPGAGRRGTLINVDISLPARFRKEGDKFLLLHQPMRELLNERDRYGHKNSFGHTLLVGGSPGRLGAICMAASATHKMGTGLVTVATWEDSFGTLLTKLPNETMAVPLKLEGPELEVYRKSLSMYSSVVVGPGLGLRSEGKRVLEEILIHYTGPLVLDADALNLVADHRMHELLVKRRAPTVLTPHVGEMARLLDISKEKVTQDPARALRDAVKRTHSTVILKGAATLMASIDELLYLSHYPNDGMATAGSGDVLAGMIGGLLGQKVPEFQATQLAVYLHSVAGDLAAESRGQRSMTAPDIVENIGNAFKKIKQPVTPALPLESRATLL